jgi:CRISPR-associated protein (TIGR03984 family)
MVGNEITLIKAVEGFEEDSYAILYSPKKCHLAIFDGTKFIDANGEIDVSDVYEARVFNADKELRWLNESDGKGNSIIISDANLPDAIGTIPQNYLLWGKKNGASLNGWTQFAEARIGAFYVPVTLVNKEYAVFKAIEYLGEFEDGNVAVFEERLMGISEVEK